MCKKLKDLPQSVLITGRYGGTYTYTGGMSYYLDGITGGGTIHFSVPGNDNDCLGDFHITYSVSGSNIGIWYKAGGRYSNVNTKNLPSSREAAWNIWWKANKAHCDTAAAEFWRKLNA